MSEVNGALQKIAKETGIIFFGTILALLLEFFGRVILARFYSVSEYGVFTLALTVLNITLLLASLGLPDGIAREIAFYRKREPSRVGEIISTSIFTVALSSLMALALIVLYSDIIAQIFRQNELSCFIRILAFVIPFSSMTGIILSVYRGFGRAKERVYFSNISKLLFLIFILVLVVLNLQFIYVFYACIANSILTFFALVFYTHRLRLFEIKFSPNLKVGKKLLMFSIPLLFIGILGFIIDWTDTLMLGYYKSAELVGLYNAASPLARLIRIFLSTAAFIYLPVASELYAKEKIKEMGRVYQILTKWIFLLTLPIFTVIFLFPEETIKFLFGAKYLPATLTFRILAFGFMFHTILGLNGLSLIVIKDSRFILFSSLSSAFSNIILNAVLIPTYGMEGAAVASLISYVIGNVLNSLRLYQKSRIHPFSWNYTKLLIISFVLLIILQKLSSKIVNMWYIILILVIFLLIYFFLVLLSRSVDREDIDLLLAIEKKLGIDLRIVKKVLKKFV